MPDPGTFRAALISAWRRDYNERRPRTGNTCTMIFGVAKLVADISQYMTLEPGDVITTGTLPGVGMGMKATPV